MGIARPVVEVYPYAWLFFVTYILISTFTMLNLFIAVVVNAMQQEQRLESGPAAEGGEPAERLHAEISALRRDVHELCALLSVREGSSGGAWR